MKIVSPVPGGSGVEVLHGALAAAVPGYRLRTYSPWWSLLPPALPALSAGDADLIHASADYGAFFARAGVPLLHVVGDADDVVPVEENTAIMESRYKELGGSIRVIHKPGVGHHPHSLEDPGPIAAPMT